MNKNNQKRKQTNVTEAEPKKIDIVTDVAKIQHELSIIIIIQHIERANK